MLRNNPLALILLAVTGVLLAVVVAQMAGWGRQPAPLQSRPADLSAIPALQSAEEAAAPVARVALLEKITARPLLSPDRKPEELGSLAENAETPEELPVTDLKAQLTSVVITPESRYAIIMDTKSRKRLTLEPGMPLEGDQGAWVLSSIEPRKVVFSAGEGKTAELELDVFAKSLPATAANRRQQNNARTNPPGRVRTNGNKNNPRGNISAEEIRRKIAERRAQLRAEAAKRNNK